MRERRIVRALPVADVVTELHKHGFDVHKSTVSRDAAHVREQIAREYSTRFDALAEVGLTCARLDHVIADASKALAGRLKPLERAALLGRITVAAVAKLEVQRRVGLVPADVTELIKVPDAPAERVPNAAEIREWIAAAGVRDADLIPRAEHEGDWDSEGRAIVDAEPLPEPQELPKAVGAEDVSVPVRQGPPTRRIGGPTALKVQRVPDPEGPEF